jgi:sulfite dehydrogenase (cytochrome) subunit B
MLRTVVALMFAAAPAFAEDAPVLKPGPGREATAVTCAVCHTLNYIRMNAPFLPPGGWRAEVAKMQQVFGGPFDDATADEIVKYLSANYGAPPKG